MSDAGLTVKFAINGVPVEAALGDNVLDTARRYGFTIPSLCHHQAIAPYGACRLCLVEIEKGGRKKLTTSCNYEVLSGIAVTTDSAEIHRHRAMVLELILAQAPTNAALLALAEQYGVKKSRFAEHRNTQRPDCILCGLCTRVCAEVISAHALTFNGRGDGRSVGSAFLDQPQSCVGCGSCAAVCPTGCIPVRDKPTSRQIWDREFEFVLCQTCGAPVITVQHRDWAVQHRELPADYYQFCQRCKQNEHSGRFAKLSL